MKYLSWLPAALIMVMIFMYSGQPSNNSNESSLFFVDGIIRFYENIAKEPLQADSKAEIEQSLNHMIRKTAHFCEYALLAAAIAFHLFRKKFKGIQLYLITVLTSALYAITDEFHQTFIPGRSGALKDVFLDTTGAAFGALLCSILIIIIIRKKSSVSTAIS